LPAMSRLFLITIAAYSARSLMALTNAEKQARWHERHLKSEMAPKCALMRSIGQRAPSARRTSQVGRPSDRKCLSTPLIVCANTRSEIRSHAATRIRFSPVLRSCTCHCGIGGRRSSLRRLLISLSRTDLALPKPENGVRPSLLENGRGAS